VKWAKWQRKQRRKALKKWRKAQQAKALVNAPQGTFICSWHGRTNPGWEVGKRKPKWSTATEADQHRAAIRRQSEM
jgi:hypothetical protein